MSKGGAQALSTSPRFHSGNLLHKEECAGPVLRVAAPRSNLGGGLALGDSPPKRCSQVGPKAEAQAAQVKTTILEKANSWNPQLYQKHTPNIANAHHAPFSTALTIKVSLDWRAGTEV